jgi:glycosyltransferase involved in cell wall biosynthesis
LNVPNPLIHWQNQCAALIPCFNEASRVGEVIRRVQSFLPQVIVVDDGSTDESAPIAERAGAAVVRLEHNSGKGHALRVGWETATQRGFKWVLMLDADGQHSAEDIRAFLECAENSGATLVVGNRMGNATAMPLVRRHVNQWMSHRISRLVGATVPDSQCGFRLARLDLLRQLPILANRFEVESAMLTAFFLHGQKVEFVPVQTIYHSAKSHIRPLADAWRWWRWRLAQRAALRACMTMRVP